MVFEAGTEKRHISCVKMTLFNNLESPVLGAGNETCKTIEIDDEITEIHALEKHGKLIGLKFMRGKDDPYGEIFVSKNTRDLKWEQHKLEEGQRVIGF